MKAKSGKLLGGKLVGSHAGENIGELALAMTQGLKPRAKNFLTRFWGWRR